MISDYEEGAEDGTRTSSKDARIQTAIPSNSGLDEIATILWTTGVVRDVKGHLFGRAKVLSRVMVAIDNSEIFFNGFIKMSILDQDQKTVEGQVKYGFIDYTPRNQFMVFTTTFEELKLKGIC